MFTRCYDCDNAGISSLQQDLHSSWSSGWCVLRSICLRFSGQIHFGQVCPPRGSTWNPTQPWRHVLAETQWWWQLLDARLPQHAKMSWPWHSQTMKYRNSIWNSSATCSFSVFCPSTTENCANGYQEKIRRTAANSMKPGLLTTICCQEAITEGSSSSRTSGIKPHATT